VVPETRPLTKAERATARERIEQYHERKLAALQAAVYAAFQQCQAGAIDAFALDQVIHEYHRQSQELWRTDRRHYRALRPFRPKPTKRSRSNSSKAPTKATRIEPRRGRPLTMTRMPKNAAIMPPR